MRRLRRAEKTHKSDMDEDRKKKGLLAFVARPRPAYFLEFESPYPPQSLLHTTTTRSQD